MNASNDRGATKREISLDDLEQVTGGELVVCMPEGKSKATPFITTDEKCRVIKHDIAET